MTILELYTKLEIPPNLQRHMTEVTAVGEYIAQAWKTLDQEPVDSQLVRDVLLVHDLGNIVKFSRPFLGELEAESEYWERIQDRYRQQYGTRATTATVAILEELNARPILAEIIQDMSPSETGEIPFVHLETRICSCADMSVTPQGIEGFEARMQDLAVRYPTERVAAAMQHERENAEFIQEKISVSLYDLPRKTLEQRAQEFLQYDALL